MYGLQSTNYKHFEPPALEPIWASKSLVFWGLNILTFGVYASAETLSKRHRVTELKLVQEDLQNQATQLIHRWNDLEKNLMNLVDQVRLLGEGDLESSESLKGSLDKFSLHKDQLQEEVIKNNYELATSLSEIARGTIAFIGHLLANIATVGFYGVYQNYKLKNQITVLEAQNTFIQDQFDVQRDEKFANLQKIIDCFNDYLATKEDANTIKEQFNGIKDTDAGKAYLAAQQAQMELAVLQKQHNALQKDATALKVEKFTLEQDKKSIEAKLAKKKLKIQDLNRRVAHMGNEEWKLKQENSKLKQDKAKKENELKDVQKQHQKETADLQVLLNAAKLKAAQVQTLEKKIQGLEATQKHQTDIINLAPQLGPIAPKYIPGPKDTEKPGAMDIDGIIDELRQKEIDFAKGYNTRYGSKLSAVSVIGASFDHACSELFDMAQKGDKIKLNHAGNTPATLGIFAVYRYMALDLVRGGKIEANGCHGFKLKINDSIEMLPSRSEKILQYKPDVAVGLKPVVEIHYRQRDHFTPDEGMLGLRDGVDAVSAKWILDQLSDEEMGYLFTHLMAPVIESTNPSTDPNYQKNTHPDYQKMRAFMQKSNDPRVKLVETASELIQDLGTAFQKNFSKNALIPHLQDQFDDWDIEPFVKKEDDQKGLKDLKDTVKVNQGPEIVDWVLDADVLGDKKPYHPKPFQPDFYNLILESQKKHKKISENMHANLLRYPVKKDEIENLDWKVINKQFHVSHQMIGSDAFTGDGGERCLFSNLLAVLVTDKKQLTSQNVQKLKNAMAAYLDKIQKAKAQWSVEKNKPAHLQSKDAAKLKEMAELAQGFEDAIKLVHGCTVPAYQAWLRNDSWGAAKIDVGNLTPLEIEVASCTIGIGFDLVRIEPEKAYKSKMNKAKVDDIKNKKKGDFTVDDYGRIMSGYFMGPNTSEKLLMGIWDPMDGKGGSYYGLHYKLNVSQNPELENDAEAFAAALDMESYWTSIDENMIKE